MRLLQVISSMDPRTGGPCQGIRNLAPSMLGLGVTSEVVCLDDPVSDYLKKEELKIHPLGKGQSSWQYNPKLFPWLNRNLSRFDAVILNGLWQYPGFALRKAIRHSNSPPYFVFPHGMLDPWFQRAPERRLKAVRNWLYWKLAEHRVIRYAEAVLFTCAKEMQLARATFRPYQPKRELDVGFGVVQPPKFHQGMAGAFRQKCANWSANSYFLFLGRIHPKKGVDILIKAYAEHCQNPKSQIGSPRLVIAGPGLDTSYGRKMQELASKLCPSGSVLWPGMLTGDAKWGALYGAEAFVLPSHQENFGISVVEALACSIPVLISNQINISREIEKDKAGFVDEDSVEGMKDLFRRWKNLSPDGKNAMRTAARNCYQNRFGVADAAQKLTTTIENLVTPTHRIGKTVQSSLAVQG